MTTVVKLGGRLQSDPQLPAALAGFIRSRRGDVVVVHGGGDAISRVQRVLGLEPRFVDGRRVTTREDLEAVRMALSGTANKWLASALLSHDVSAVGISGEDGACIVARPGDPSLGLVGVPHEIDVRLLLHLLSGGYVPVLSPVARDSRGGYGDALNMNGDDCAAAVASALGSSELLLLADVAGVLDGQGEAIPQLTRAAAGELASNGTATGGMIAKLQAAEQALVGGVGEVRIGGIEALRDPSRGTRIISAHAGELRSPAHAGDSRYAASARAATA